LHRIDILWDCVVGKLGIVNIMAFTFYSLLEATLLCLNAVCILHEERFLAKSMTVNIYCLSNYRNAYKRGVTYGTVTEDNVIAFC